MKSMMTRAVTGASCRDVLAGSIGLYAGLFSPSLFLVASADAATHAEGTRIMSTIKTKDGTEIFYKDWGPRDAQAIVFHHGWPLSADDWDTQMLFPLPRVSAASPMTRPERHDHCRPAGRLKG